MAFFKGLGRPCCCLLPGFLFLQVVGDAATIAAFAGLRDTAGKPFESNVTSLFSFSIFPAQITCLFQRALSLAYLLCANFLRYVSKAVNLSTINLTQTFPEKFPWFMQCSFRSACLKGCECNRHVCSHLIRPLQRT